MFEFWKKKKKKKKKKMKLDVWPITALASHRKYECTGIEQKRLLQCKMLKRRKLLKLF